jgi:hypothetical protein
MQAATIGVGSQVKRLVFDGSPKPFNENVVHGTPLGVHANFYPVGKQRFDHFGLELCVVNAPG